MIPNWLAIIAAAAILVWVGAWFAVDILRTRRSAASHEHREDHRPGGQR